MGVVPWVDNSAGWFNGKLDDIRIYDRALTREDVERLYREGDWPRPVVTTLLPFEGEVLNTSDVTVYWAPSYPEVDKYWVEVAADSEFTFKAMDSSITTTNFVLRNLFSNKYYWRVRAHNYSGWGEFSAPKSFTVVVTSVGDGNTPTEFGMSQNYPNPFNPSTEIQYTVPERSDVRLYVYNSVGQEVATLVSAVLDSGTYSVKWDAFGMSSGVYVYRMVAGNFVDTKQMILIK